MRIFICAFAILATVFFAGATHETRIWAIALEVFLGIICMLIQMFGSYEYGRRTGHCDITRHFNDGATVKVTCFGYPNSSGRMKIESNAKGKKGSVTIEV